MKLEVMKVCEELGLEFCFGCSTKWNSVEGSLMIRL